MNPTPIHPKLLVLGCAILFCWAPCATRAGVILDTGASSSIGALIIPPATNAGQHFAARFTILEPIQVTGLFTKVLSGFDPWNGQSFDLRIYNDSGGVAPAGGTSVDEYIYKSAVIVPTSNDWWGQQGLAWDLAAGTYWLGMIARSGDVFTYAPATPMEAYAGIWAGNEWLPTESPTHQFPARIEGVIIPEPSTAMLMLLSWPVVLRWQHMRGKRR